jgi:hypothetical protein
LGVSCWIVFNYIEVSLTYEIEISSALYKPLLYLKERKGGLLVSCWNILYCRSFAAEEEADLRRYSKLGRASVVPAETSPLTSKN